MSHRISGQVRSNKSRMVSHFCAKNADVVPASKSVVVCMLHLITNMNAGYGQNPMQEDCGFRIQHQADIRFRTNQNKPDFVEDDYCNKIGINNKWVITKSALGPPAIVDECVTLFDTGPDIDEEASSVAKKLGIISDEGTGRYTYQPSESLVKELKIDEVPIKFRAKKGTLGAKIRELGIADEIIDRVYQEISK